MIQKGKSQYFEVTTCSFADRVFIDHYDILLSDLTIFNLSADFQHCTAVQRLQRAPRDFVEDLKLSSFQTSPSQHTVSEGTTTSLK